MGTGPTLGILYPFPKRYATSILLDGLARALERDHGWRVIERVPGGPGGRLRTLAGTLRGLRVGGANAWLGVIDVPTSLRLLRWRSRTPVLGVWYDAFSDIARRPPGRWRPMQRLILDNVRACDLVLPVSAELARMAREIRGQGGVEELALVGADGARFDPARTDGRALRARLGIAPDEVVIGLVGRIGGHATTGDRANFTGRPLVRQATQVVAQAAPRKLRFVIVGFGPGLPLFQQAVRESGVAERFHFTGAVPHAEVPDHLAAMDICLDLLDDVFSGRARNETKIKEYMAMGRCIAASAIGEIVRDLDGGAAGALLRPDASDLAPVLGALARNEARRQALGAQARRRFETHYAWPVLATRFHAVLQRVLAARGPQPSAVAPP